MKSHTQQPDKMKQLAKKISNEFNEPEKQGLYQNLLTHYNIETIQKAFEDVKKVPIEKIKKSQSALFIFLLKKYASTQNKNS